MVREDRSHSRDFQTAHGQFPLMVTITRHDISHRRLDLLSRSKRLSVPSLRSWIECSQVWARPLAKWSGTASAPYCPGTLAPGSRRL